MIALSRVLLIFAITLQVSEICRADEAMPNASSTASNTSQSQPASHSSSNQTTIVFLGDSLTAGFGLPPEAALPEQVKERLAAEGFDARIINAGVSGDTTASGLARYDWSVAGAKPDLLVVALGANDYLMGISPDVARANLAAILDRARADGTNVILAGLRVRSTPLPGSPEEMYAEIYQELADAYGVPLYPALLEGVRDKPQLLQPDGLHPTAEGVQVIADSLTEFILPRLD